MPQLESGHKATLLELLAQPPEPPEGTQWSQEELQERRFLERMQELSRGLVDSEYWELVRVAIIEELEIAKGALESETISDKDFRIKQGEAKALTMIHNKFLKLAASVKEKENGEKPD